MAGTQQAWSDYQSPRRKSCELIRSMIAVKPMHDDVEDGEAGKALAED